MKWLVSAFWKETSNLSTMNVMISIQIVSKDKISSNSRNKDFLTLRFHFLALLEYN